jgi:uncharacterized protein (DUF1697 family)
MKHVALLRGINLGKHRRISMACLRDLLASLGYLDVATYLQSGNAVFRLPKACSDDQVEAAIHQTILHELGMNVEVFVRDSSFIHEVVANCPFADADERPKDVHVYFLRTRPLPFAIDAARQKASGPDLYVVEDRVIYVRLADRFAPSSLTAEFWNTFQVSATSRNWRTVTNLAALLS